MGYWSNKKSYLQTNNTLQEQTIQVPFDNITANLIPQLDTFNYQVQQNHLSERQRSQQLDQRITELHLEIANLEHQLHILFSSRVALTKWNRKFVFLDVQYFLLLLSASVKKIIRLHICFHSYLFESIRLIP